jgi:gliding motility-associated-like protein
MRIFTLGKNGITLFYFAFILFSGTYSYGQQVDSCGVTDQNTETAGNQQYFCDSQEAELNNLLVAGENITFYSDAGYTNELNATDLLIGGRTYYIDADGCQSSVTVTIFNQPQILGVEEDALTRRPEASTKQSLGTLGICVADVENPNVFVSDLRTNAPAGTIQWYMSATGTGEPQLIADPATEELQNNTYYYAERLYNDPVDSDLNCATNRARTLVLLTAEAAPEAAPEQEFCASDNPTVGDIVASGDNRYYATATSTVEISQNALLEDGRTYYVSTLGQSCESELRSPVTVTIQEPVELEDQVGIVCETEVSETFPSENSIREYYINLLGEGYSEDGTFEPTIDEILEDYSNSNGTGDFTTTYTVNTGLCESQADLTIRITAAEDADAGEIEDITLDCDENSIYVLDIATLSPNANAGGTFSGEGINQEGNFDPSVGPGEYTITYTVGADDENTCLTGTDSTSFTITVEGLPNLGEEIVLTRCISEVLALLDNPQDAITLFTDILEERGLEGNQLEGNFDPAIEIIGLQILGYINNPTTPSQTFETTYIVTTECGTESVDIALTINEGGTIATPEAGIVCETEVSSTFPNNTAVRNFYLDLLPEGVSRNGTFEPSIQEMVEEYQDDSDGLGDFTTTYTVDNGECVASADLTISIIEAVEASTGEISDASFCSAGNINLFAQLTDDNTPGGTFFNEAGEEIIDGILSPSGEGEFTVTYTVSENDEETCLTGSDSTSFTVNVTEGSANAGDDVLIELCAAQVDNFIANPAEAIAFLSGIIDEDADQTGTFEPSLGSIVAQWTSNPLGTFTSTYTVGNDECEDSAEITIVVTEDGPSLGEEQVGTVCESDVSSTFPNNTAVEDFYLALLPEGVSRNGTFEPSIQAIVDQYQDDSDGLGDFTTTYTVDNGECVASVDLTVQIVPVEDANAGTIADQTVCSTDGMIDLSAYLSDEATTGGTFTGTGVDENGMFNPATGVGVYTITYFVDDSADCVTPGTEDSTTFEIEVLQGADLGEDITATVCETDLADDFDADDFTAYYMSLLGDLPANGTFNPSLTSLYDDYTDQSTGTFTTTYTVGSEACEDSVQISLTINEEEDANAGTIADQTVCSTDGLIDLSTYLSDEATTGGTFSGTGVDENGMFNPATGVDVYTITYFVDDSADCVTPGTEDSTTFEIQVLEGPDAGSDNSVELCNGDIQAGLFDGDVDLLRAFYLDMLDEGVSRDGTFTTNLQDLVDRYDSGDEIGEFTAIYTISNENCATSVELTINVVDGQAPNAGEDMDLAFCTTEGAQDLTEYLAAGVNTSGSFEGLEDGIFDPSEMETGEYSYTYTVTTTGECGGTDTATITVILSDSPEAPEVDNAVFCVSEGATVADLDAERGLNWYRTADLGTPAPADQVLVEGPYFVTQTNEGGCESEATEVTVTLEDTPAPTLTQGGNVFCELDNPTIADLNNNIVETGNITWYDAATGGEAYSSADRLEHGVTYYASLTDATSTCESSQRLAVTVNLETCELLIPEAFSPNGDGINDRFEIENISAEYPNFGMEIYNRWGNKVFTGNSSNSTWDGTSDDGSLGDGVLPVGVYFYILNFNDGQTAPIQGRVYLSR